MKECIQYIRVSTNKQQASSLGLEAQEHAIECFCEREKYDIVAKFQDVDSGANDEREALTQAIKKAQELRIPIIVSKLCRLSREVYFISKLMKYHVPFIVVEMGQEVPPFMLHIVASLNEEMRRQISINTRNALQQAKRKGVKLGTQNPKVLQGISRKGQANLERVYPHIREAQRQGLTSRKQIADYLNEQGVKPVKAKSYNKNNISSLLVRIKKAIADGKLDDQLQFPF